MGSALSVGVNTLTLEECETLAGAEWRDEFGVAFASAAKDDAVRLAAVVSAAAAQLHYERATKTREEVFFSQLQGFLGARHELDAVAAEVLVVGAVLTLDDVTPATPPLQVEEEMELDANYALAERCAPEFAVFCADLAAHSCSSASTTPAGLLVPPLKGRPRSEEKVANEYAGDARRLVDVLRASIVVDDEASLEAALRDLLRSDRPEKTAQLVRFKNRFKTPTFNGYRDALANVRIWSADGSVSCVVEVQVHLRRILAYKGRTHVYYQFFRAYFQGDLEAVAERMRYLEETLASDLDGSFTFSDLTQLRADLSCASQEAAECARDAAETKACVDAALSAAREQVDATRAAVEALGDKELKGLGELKGLNNPPQGIDQVITALVLVTFPEVEELKTWKGCKAHLKDVRTIANRAKTFDPDSISAATLEKLRKYTSDDNFTADNMRSKSAACTAFVIWIKGLEAYAATKASVAPLEKAATDANNRYIEAQARTKNLASEISLVSSLTA